MSLSFGVLGRLEVRHEGMLLPPLPPQQRIVLCLLLLWQDEPVPDDVLCEALWGEPCTSRHRQRLAQVVSKLRDALSDSAGGGHISRSPSGYQLEVDADQVDARRFEQRLARGANLLRARTAQARSELEAAEALWRGRAYRDVDDQPEFEDEIRRLHELRRSCRELRLEALLVEGHPDRVVDEVAPTAEADALRERTQYLYLLALYRTGRKIDASRHYERLWQLLREDRLEPGPELKELYERILVDDAELLATGPRSAPETRALPPGAYVALEGPAFVEAGGRADAIARIEATQPPVVLVRGEPGSGKSRVAAEIARRAHDRHGTVLWGRSVSGPAPPYRAFLQALAPVLGHEGDGQATVARLTGEDGAAPATVEGFYDAVLHQLQQAAATADVTLIIDDLQWIGDDGLGLWHRLLQAQPAGVTLVATMRTVPGTAEPAWLADLRAAGRVAVVDLGGLEPEAVTELARALGRDVTPADAEDLVARTNGNVFYLVTLLSDASYRDVGTLTEDLVAAVLLPFHRLPAASRRLLEAGSLIGRAWAPGTVARALEVDDPERALQPALEAGILRRAAGAATVEFCHDIVHEAVREQLDEPRLRDLHHRLASFGESEASSGHQDPGDAAGLADHFLLAAVGDLDRVVHYSVAAGHEARAAFAWSDAADHYRKAIDAAALGRPLDPRGRCRLLLLLAGAQQAAYRIADARRVLVEAATLAWEQRMPTELDQAITGLVTVHEYGDSESDARDLVGRAGRVPDLPPARRALYTLARARLGELPPDQADALLDEAEELARSTPNEALLALVLSTACLVRWRPDTLAWRLETAEEVRELAERAALADLTLQSHRIHAAALMEAGDAAGARRDFRRFITRSAGRGRPAFDAGVAQVENGFDLLHGNFAAVEARLPRVLDGVADGANFAAAYLAQMHHLQREQGRSAEAIPVLRALLDDDRFPSLRVALSIAELEQGDPGVGAAELDRAVAGGLKRFDRDWLWLATMAEVAEAAALAERAELAAEVHAALLPFADQLVMLAYGVVCFGSAHRFVGQAAVAAGRHAEGVSHLRRAVRIDDELGAGPALVRDHLALGRAWSPHTPGPHDVDAARQSLAEAERRAGQLGMAHAAEVAGRELHALG